MDCIGVDIIEIARIERAVARFGERFLHRVYTNAEIEVCGGRMPSLAARFAAKEAAAKALGIGIGDVEWKEIEILRGPRGEPTLRLLGKALALAQSLGWREWSVSMSHTHEHAIAVVAARD